MIPGLKKRVFNFQDLLMYVALIRKHLRLTALLICFTLTAALVYYIYARPVYYARSIVRVEAVQLHLDADSVYHDSNINAIITQLQSPPILERTAKELGINAEYRDIKKKYLKKMTITQNVEKNFEIEVWAYSYGLTAKWTETMLREFLKFRQQQRMQYRESVMKSFKEEMEQISKKLDQNAGQKIEFAKEKDLTRAQIALNEIKTLPEQLVRIKQRVEEMESIRKRLEDPGLDSVQKLSLMASLNKDVQINVGQVVANGGANNPATEDKTAASAIEDEKQTAASTPAPGVIVVPSLVPQNEQTTWEDLEKQMRDVQAAISEGSRIYLPGHQKMVALRKQLDDIDRKLNREYESAKARFDLEYNNLLSKERELEAKLPEYQEINKKYAKIQQETVLHDAGQLAWTSIYGQAAKSINTLDFAGEKERISLEYVGIKELPSSPISPKPSRLLILALFLGTALGVGIPFLIEYLDFTVSNFEQVETTFQMRGLGIIPRIEGEGETEQPMLLDTEADTDQNLVENFRVIRTNLLSMGALSKSPQVVMITSAMPKEGKTVVSSNLAISFAQMGAKTLLIDTDLRRGRLHRLFGFRKSPGLSSVLLDQMSLDEALRPSGRENLTVLTAGQHLEAGTELLGSPKFQAIMEELRGRFDRIIVDTPPVLGLSETSILQNQVDGVLFVIWSGHTPIRNMKTAVEILQANGANFYGFILNRLDLTATTNYYQYYYYSNDYYHSYHALENA